MKEKIFNRIMANIETELWFLEDYLRRYEETDWAGLRSIFLLFSFNCELLLKALYVKNKEFNNDQEIVKELQNLKHNLGLIGGKIGKENLMAVGINNIIKNNDGYDIELDSKTIKVKDFTNIRYDFISGHIRSVSQEEHKIMREDIEAVRGIIKKIKE